MSAGIWPASPGRREGLGFTAIARFRAWCYSPTTSKEDGLGGPEYQAQQAAPPMDRGFFFRLRKIAA